MFYQNKPKGKGRRDPLLALTDPNEAGLGSTPRLGPDAVSAPQGVQTPGTHWRRETTARRLYGLRGRITDTGR